MYPVGITGCRGIKPGGTHPRRDRGDSSISTASAVACPRALSSATGWDAREAAGPAEGAPSARTSSSRRASCLGTRRPWNKRQALARWRARLVIPAVMGQFGADHVEVKRRAWFEPRRPTVQHDSRRRLIAGRATGSPDPGRGPHRLFSAPGGAPRTGPPTAPLRPLAGRVTGTMIARPALGRHDAARASPHAAVSGRAGLLSLRVLRPGSSRGGTPTCATSRPAWATITAADSWPRGMTVDAADGPTSRLDQPFVGDRAPGRASRIQRR
jgi:hypothetical protein